MAPLATSMNKNERTRKGKKQHWLAPVAHVGSWLPLAYLVYAYWQNSLGIDPIREILFQTGTTALVLLVLSLAITPVKIMFGWNQLFTMRKWFGLYGFMYVTLHLLTFVWLDYGWDVAFIIDGIVNQRFVIVGFIAFLLLVPLAVTSTKGWQKRLGKRWVKLHKLSYLIVILALVHFFWLVKNVYTEPVIYAAIVGGLLLLRWKPVKLQVQRWQRQVKMRLRRAS